MSAAKHTPGPWFPTRDSQWNPVCRIGRAWDISSKLPLSEFGHPDMDAHLIASAPDMLQALLDVLAGHNDPELFLPQVRAAIAKATGSAS